MEKKSPGTVVNLAIMQDILNQVVIKQQPEPLRNVALLSFPARKNAAAEFAPCFLILGR